MKIFAVLSLASVLALGAGSAAGAVPLVNSLDLPATSYHEIAEAHPHHHCHGMSSGTADASCGTMTGGPSGGLF